MEKSFDQNNKLYLYGEDITLIELEAFPQKCELFDLVNII